ncbi:M3 family oligoendopeptidase [Clostridium sp. 'deep sea']|uniref:M3 family oligoendopeptidase n=1 Tax=Clostridium sp. 'deep sea' TaxID=2779445 RepID=UPI0018964923|nr:M3 family oligoendopeptidase [Clostridium sp. 'deep sea']QOR36882.1 M3 family oligoendopeptidase [Clostridium sp. 'deep sea']
MLKNLSPTWDLDVYFAGGSESTEFTNYIKKLEKQMKDFQEKMKTIETASGCPDSWKFILTEIQEIDKKIQHAKSFVSCLVAQNVQDKKAMQLRGIINSLIGVNSSLENNMQKRLLELTDKKFNNLLQNKYFAPLKFNLNEIRERASKKLTADKENIINDLSVDGLHAWGTLYSNVTGKLKIPVEVDGEVKKLSVGQASAMMRSPNRIVREKVFESWSKSWSGVADSCALAINSIAGFRLNVCKQRGCADFMSETLELNRINRKILETMWSVISINRGRLVKYLKRKKEILGVNKLSWHDYPAPLGTSQNTYNLENRANFLVKHISNFSPTMGKLVTRAFEERWVETENRDNKRAGAFCARSPLAKQTRVFLTYTSKWNIITLAHELGHAYHQSVIYDLPPLAQRYSQSVSETASTFFEFVVTDALFKAAPTKEEKIDILNFDLQRAVRKLMNTHARYLFETSFYEKRKSGFVSTNELNELMLKAQKEAFNDSLDEYHPYFWASLLHFYLTRVPFYHFPYTFGFLFSAGIYAQSKAQGDEFEQNYINLLRDTGRMRVEDLAMKYLGVDLEEEKFWKDAIDIVLSGIDEFMELTK